MKTRAGRVLVIVALVLSAAAGEGADAFEQPPVEFAVELGGVATPLADGESRQVAVGSTPVAVSLKVKPTRLLRTRGLSFRFPRGHELEREVERDGVTWTLEGDRDMVVLCRLQGKEALTSGLQDLVSGYVQEMKGPPARTAPVQATLGGRQRTGERVEFQMEGGRFISEAFAFEAAEESYLIAFTESVLDGETSPLPATAAARKLVSDTLTLGAGADAETSPYEFQVALGGVTVDLVEGESRDVTVGGASVKARMLVLPTRSLRAPEVSFRFPREHEVDLEARPDGTSRWTVEGEAEFVMLVRTASGGGAAAQVQGVLDEIGETMGAPKRSVSVETRFGGEKRTGRRAEFSKSFLNVTTELYPFRAGDAGYVLVFNQTWNALQKPGPPAARRVVEETLAIAK